MSTKSAYKNDLGIHYILKYYNRKSYCKICTCTLYSDQGETFISKMFTSFTVKEIYLYACNLHAHAHSFPGSSSGNTGYACSYYDLRNSSLLLIHKQYSYNSDELQNVEHDICFKAFKMLIATQPIALVDKVRCLDDPKLWLFQTYASRVI